MHDEAWLPVLGWETQKNNIRDTLRDGTHPSGASENHCSQGHEYTPKTPTGDGGAGLATPLKRDDVGIPGKTRVRPDCAGTPHDAASQ